jgi:hypothetical protein
MFWIYFFIFVFASFLSWAWVTAIDGMKKNHPDYKGEDFLSLDDEDKDWLG